MRKRFKSFSSVPRSWDLRWFYHTPPAGKKEMLFWHDSQSDIGYNSHSNGAFHRLISLSYNSRWKTLPIAGDPKKYQEGLSMIVSFEQMLEKAKQTIA